MKDVIMENREEIYSLALAGKGKDLCKKFGFEFVDVDIVPKEVELEGGTINFDREDIYIGYFDNDQFNTMRLGRE